MMLKEEVHICGLEPQLKTDKMFIVGVLNPQLANNVKLFLLAASFFLHI
jgi:hypothetical protein